MATVTDRLSFARIREALPIQQLDLVAIQRDSFDWLLAEGLQEIFDELSPIEDSQGKMSLSFMHHRFEEPKYSEEECKEKDYTFAKPLFVTAEFLNKEDGTIKSQTVFMGDFPVMTGQGTFIVNGTERVVVSQLVRSPGVYFDTSVDKTTGRDVYGCKVIPGRGAWLEFEVDKRDLVAVRVDRKRKQPVSVLYRALQAFEYSEETGQYELAEPEKLQTPVPDEEILEFFGGAESVALTLEKDNTGRTPANALEEIYRKLRPGEPPSADQAGQLLLGMYFQSKKYDLQKVGRYKILGLTDDGAGHVKHGKLSEEYDVLDFERQEGHTLTREDVLATMSYLVKLHAGEPGYDTDDIDHFGNRRLRSVGELIQNQFRIGLSRMERVVRERMTTQDMEAITPQTLINIRPVVSAIREFFGTSQLSQFMDQTNPLAGLTHKRRLSALGPGGLSRERAGFEVRDVHPSHYGRMCPIETPEGPNIGLIGSLATYARINRYGFIETPYRKAVDGQVTDELEYLTADEEDRYVIAQANAPLADDGHFSADLVLVRSKGGEVREIAPKLVDYMDVSPRQIVSISAALIPFLEHDDANRALMGANMQRQAVPLLKADAPLVGTGIEDKAAKDAGDVVVARSGGVVVEVAADHIVVKSDDDDIDRYYLTKFQRSNQGTCLNHRPIVVEGQRVEAGAPLADGPSTDQGELALGRNLLVAFMSWEGFNYEDAIILSERLVREDSLTSIHIEQLEVDARETKLGPEEITRDIPNVSEEMLANLDEEGIIRIGAEVVPGDILVGKVTPKGETELTPEERLLRAIFGEKAREVRDTSLKVPHGDRGIVIGVQKFSRLEGDDLQPGVNDLVRVYVATKRKITQGDKLAGRHGNKGVISKVLPEEDMPFLADGTPVDIVLNPLGVPSRMNVGQVLETHLGWAAANGWEFDAVPDWFARVRLGRRADRRRGAGPPGHPGVRRGQRGRAQRPAGQHPAHRRGHAAGQPRRQGPAVRRPHRRAGRCAHHRGLHLHAQAAPPGRRQDPRPFDRAVLDDHPAAAGREGPVRWPALRRDGGLGPEGLRGRLRPAGDAHHQVRRHDRPREGLRGDRQGRQHPRGRHPRVVQGAGQGDAGARAVGRGPGRRRVRDRAARQRRGPVRCGQLAGHRPVPARAAHRGRLITPGSGSSPTAATRPPRTTPIKRFCIIDPRLRVAPGERRA